MKSSNIILVTVIFLSLFSCGEQKEDQVFKVFNEGVSLNLNSIEEQNKGNFENAASLNKQSIDKFKETLELDSAHGLARSALGHSLYVDKQFREAISWFNQANKVNGEEAVNFREMGLCKINIGQIKNGKENLDKAFSMETTKEIKELTIQDLVDTGELAFQYGEDFIQQGDSVKGKDFKKFSISVLLLAFQYDKTRKDIASKISDFADKFGDRETATNYKILSEK